MTAQTLVVPPNGPPSDLVRRGNELLDKLSSLHIGDILHVIGIIAATWLAVLILVLVAATVFGWSPARLRNWSVGSLLIPSVAMLTDVGWTAPILQFHGGTAEVLHGTLSNGISSMAVLIVPAAWIAATALYTHKRVKLATTGYQNAAHTERAVWAHTQRQLRSAGRMSRHGVPFTTGGLNPQPVLGRLASEDSSAPPKSMLRELFGRNESLLVMPLIKFAEHLISVGNTGSGKTTLMFRAILSWYVTVWTRHGQWWRTNRQGRPLAIIVDCNGGPKSVDAAEALRDVFVSRLGVPADRFGIFPRDVQLDLWNMDRDDMRVVLGSMISGGNTPTTDTEKYFHEIRETLIHLIVDAPKEFDADRTPIGENPPRDGIEFLSRFEPNKLARLWGGVFDARVPWGGAPGVDLEIGSLLAGKQPVLHSARAEFGNLLRVIGAGFDGATTFTDFDVLYCVLEGTSQPDRARAQFGALGCILEQLATKQHGRTCQVFFDEFSAVSDGKSRAAAWVQRFRKASIGTVWFAQNWIGLGPDDDNRESLVDAGAGGALLARQEGGDKLCKKFGTKRGFELSRKLIRGAAHGDEGNMQAHDGWLVDPNRLRTLSKGDIAHASAGRVRWGHITPLDHAALAALRPLVGIEAMETRPVQPQTSAPSAAENVIDLAYRRKSGSPEFEKPFNTDEQEGGRS